VDREAVRQILRAWPEVRLIARANRAFLRRAVRFLAGQAGIRQFLDIGTGIPAAGNVHEIAGQAAPGARVVYVDNDPIVHVHASALLTGSGTASVVLADLRDPHAILADPVLRARIDFAQPVGLLLVAILHFITSTENPSRIIATLRDALPAGSYVVLSHATADFHPPGTTDKAAAAYQNATAPLILRTRAEIATYFDGFDLLDPGLVQAPLWHPDSRAPRPKDLAGLTVLRQPGTGHRWLPGPRPVPYGTAMTASRGTGTGRAAVTGAGLRSAVAGGRSVRRPPRAAKPAMTAVATASRTNAEREGATRVHGEQADMASPRGGN